MNRCAIHLRRLGRQAPFTLMWLAAWILPLLVISRVFAANEQGGQASADDSQATGWEFFQAIELPASTEAKWVDLVLGPEVFTHARADLGDLRMLDDSGHMLPYALRVLRPSSRREAFAVEEYNRAVGQKDSRELTLDLKQSDVEHNQIEIITPGNNFRRRVELEGSPDGQNWSILAETSLLRFRRGDRSMEVDTVSYSPSRFRQLRIRVFPDPQRDEGPITIESVKVVKKTDLPGEVLTLPATVGERMPVRADGAAASAWIIDLGGDRVPCEKIEVEIDDVEFARNYYVEAVSRADTRERFERVALTGDNLWQHRAGEPKEPLAGTFREVRASKLKLIVVDYDNPPLKIRSVRFSAPVRQFVFERVKSSQVPWRLFFGNPRAEAPNYDFARNLPDRLPTAPERATIGPLKRNPSFVPPPLPLTERWPWLIYVVLATVSLVLLLIIISVARTSITIHDQQQIRPRLSSDL